MSSSLSVGDLLSLWQDQRDQGRDVPPEELCRDCPEHAAEVARHVAFIKRMERMTGDEDSGALRPTLRPTVADTDEFRLPPARELPGLPGYRIEEVLGRGGMGVVYKAVDLKLNRTVAVKMIQSGPWAGPEEVRRFLAEAEVIAALRHPGIVLVHERGEHQGRPYFVMEWCDGGNLSARLGRRPQPARDAARLVEQIADAVHFAHEHGIVHRDLKPSNILLKRTEDSQKRTEDRGQRTEEDRTFCPLSSVLCPLISDFGLAKWADHGGDFTQTLAVMGTPGYMAPEQASGGSKRVGPAADVWSLWAILYEMLTGRPPFRGDSPLATIRLVEGSEPASVRSLQPKVPRDLELICLKCLRKDPRQRYQSARELADDLRRFLNDEPIRARSVGAGERLWLWCRRNPLAAVLTTLLVTVALAVPKALMWYEARVCAAEELAREEGKAAEAARELAATQEYYAALSDTRKHNAEAAPGWTWSGLDNLARAARLPTPARDLVELRSAAAACLGGVDLRLRPTTTDPSAEDPVYPTRVGGGLVATVEDGVIALSDPQSDGVLRRLRDPGREVVHDGEGVQDMAFHPSGSLLATAGADRRVKLWEVASGRLLSDVPVCGELPLRLSWSPDGRTLEVACDGRVARYELGGLTVQTFESIGATVLELPVRGDEANPTAFSPDGQWLVSGSRDRVAKLWRLEGETFRPYVNLPAPGAVQVVGFSPDGKRLLVRVQRENAVRVWDLELLRERLKELGLDG